FSSLDKFESGTGWPSFFKPIKDDSIITKIDKNLFSERTEVRSKVGNSHLGHVFAGEGYGTPTDQRYCINSVSLKLVPQEADGHGTAQS
ncbi:MAG: peptide-methionine (R)-S-oxide reductase, partial [Pseudarthrobacter sp.]